MSRPVDPDADELLTLPAVDLARMVAAGECTARRLVAAHIERLRAVQPAINAVTADRFDHALADADAIDAARAAGRPLPPLAGVPFTAKEMISIAGMPHTLGTLARRADVATADATVIVRLRGAGAIPIATTNVPEWGFWSETDNLLYGRTRNPWDTSRTAGGSSGGEAAVIAAGGAPFGLGSDIGGSIRIPAAFCGVFAHKPSSGLVPLTGHYPVYADGPDAALEKRAPYLVLGPMTRSARDLMPLLRVIAGPDETDPNATPMQPGDPDTVDWNTMRVLLLDDPRIRFAAGATDEVSAAVRNAARLLEAAGARVAMVDAALFRDTVDLWSAALRSAASATVGEASGLAVRGALARAFLARLRRRPTHSLPVLLFVLGERVAARRHRDPDLLLARLADLRQRFLDLLGDDGIMLMPPHPRTAPRHNRPLLRPFDFAYTAIFNALRVPVSSAPMGVDRNGLPLGVQVAAPPGADHLCIAAAERLEAGYGRA